MPAPIERRKSSKQLLEEKQIKRYLRSKKRSRKRGAQKRDDDADHENDNEIEDHSKLGVEIQESSVVEDFGSVERRKGPRWMEYKITEIVTTETKVTYVKVPKQFLENKKLTSKLTCS